MVVGVRLSVRPSLRVVSFPELWGPFLPLASALGQLLEAGLVQLEAFFGGGGTVGEG